MNRAGYAILVLFSVSLLIAIIGYASHDGSPTWTLAPYADDLKPGTSREVVEAYLNARGVRFRPEVLQNDTVLNWKIGSSMPSHVTDPPIYVSTAPPADVIEIGEIPASFVCTEGAVTIVFEFTPRADGPFDGRRWNPQKSDRLKSIALSNRIGGCS